MFQDNNDVILQIEHTHKFIQNICLDFLGDDSAYYNNTYKRIANANEILFNDAAKINRNQTSKFNLSLEDIQRILLNILNTLLSCDNAYSKEKNIAKILADDNLKPDLFLFLDTWDDFQFDKLQIKILTQ